MAGSYNHCVTNTGNLASNERIVGMLENGGDVYEAVEEMFGMIWHLAKQSVGDFDLHGDKIPDKLQAIRTKEWVETARQNYQEGLKISKNVHRLSPDIRRTY